MDDTFTSLGLSERVAAAARAAGYDRPTPLQAAAAPVLRRGGNLTLHASTGAGLTAAFALPLLDRLTEEDADAAPDPRALVLVATPSRAESLAERMSVLAGDTGVTVRATVPGWHAQGAAVRVTTPAQALADVQASALKLEGIVALVVVDAAEIFALGGGDALETLVTLVPRDAQRVITSGELADPVEQFVETHARRALTVPPRPADRDAAPAPAALGQIGYMVVPEAGKPEMLARLLEGADEALVRTRTAARAERVLGSLARRGITSDAGVRVRTASFEDDVEGAARIVSYDVPFSAEDLRRIHATGGTVLVTPAELTHFRRIAAEAPFTLKHRRARVLDLAEVTAYRERVREALETEDIGSQLMLLDPLFEDRSAAEVAAALSALLRRRPAPERAQDAAATTAAGAEAARGPAAPTGAAPKAATTGGFTRLFVSIGSRDNVRPGDIVGAFTGEANIRGDQVGRVDIRESFSVVEVAADVAERVIRALNGTTMRGRSLRVDFDRKAGGGSDAPRGRGAGGRDPGGYRPGGPRQGGRQGGPRGPGDRSPGRGPRN